MEFINETHRNLVNEMIVDFTGKEADKLSLKEIVELLFENVKRNGVENLLKFFDSHGFYTAPASTKFHGNFEGGLAAHSINVCALLYNQNKIHNLNLSKETIIISALCHDMCKLDFYKPTAKNEKIYLENGENAPAYARVQTDPLGRFYWDTKLGYMAEDQMPMPHASKSLYMLQGFISVSREEAFLIMWHMGPFGCLQSEPYGFNNAVDYQPSCAAMYTADFLASSLYEKKID